MKMVNADKSTIPAKQHFKTVLECEIIDKYNDGKTYADKNGKLRNKENLGCDFWVRENGQLKTVQASAQMGKIKPVEAKCKMGNFVGLVPHQIDRLIEGGYLAVVDLKNNNAVKVLTWNDIKNRDDILAQLNVKNSRVTIGLLRLYY